ncbi:MAG: Na+/H antiporter NhaA [Actinomycetota bacterium]|jgi:Na+/H+ antiporter NhaA
MAHAIATWLLPIFFALVGVELRSEIKSGVFKTKRDLVIPFSAATFGVLVPFLIYQAFVIGFNIDFAGWGVVVATDLPLALLALKLFKQSTAHILRPYLLSLAIFDDLISIVLIALVYHQNGIHPTVYGFLIGLLLPVTKNSKLIRHLDKFVNFVVIPLFVIATIAENLTFEIGLLTLAVIVARMGGKPIGIFIGDLFARKLLKSSLLNTKEVLAIGTLATLGLSVSLLFTEIAKAPAIAISSVFLVIPIALIRIKVLSKSFLKGDF